MTTQPANSPPCPACPCCGAGDLHVVGAIPRHVRFAGVMLDEPTPASDLVRCGRCELRFRWPAPTVDEIAKLYQQGENEKWSYESHDRVDWTLARQELTALSAEGTVLDIGCWDGHFADKLPAGWSCSGVEIHDGAAQRAAGRGVEMIGKSLNDVTGHDNRFDAVVAFDVAEHVHNPGALVDDMLRMARPGGIVLVATGNTQARSWRLMGSRYWYCALPEHLAFVGDDWYRWFAGDRGVELKSLHAYSHAPHRSAVKSVIQAASNLTYRVAPGVIAGARAVAGLRRSAKPHPAQRRVPPNWMASRDHAMGVFRKPASAGEGGD